MTDRHRIRWTRIAAPLPGLVLAMALAACGDDGTGQAPARPVLVAQPRPAPDHGTSLPGEIRAREERPLAFQVGGHLVRREVDVGDRVSRGDLLAVLDPADLETQVQAASARLAAAEAQLRRAAADRNRFATLAEDRLVSRSALDAQEAAWRAAEGEVRAARAAAGLAGNQTAHTRLRAPADGVITGRMAEAGQVVAAGQAVLTLASDGGREVAIALPETMAGAYAIGQEVEVELWSAPGTRLRGQFREISPAADPDTRTYAARVALDGEAAARVALGQSARVHLGGAGAILSVPLSAVQRGADGNPMVWVFEDGRVRATPVRTGTFGADSVPVTEGLDAGDRVVVAGGHLLRDGQDVTAVDRDNRPVATDAPASP